MAITTHGNTSKMPHLDLKEVHACLDYTLTDYSHLDYRRLDYKAIWTTYNVWTIAVWTTKPWHHEDVEGKKESNAFYKRSADVLSGWTFCQEDVLSGPP